MRNSCDGTKRASSLRLGKTDSMDRPGSELVSRAASLLAREVARLPSAFSASALPAATLPARTLPAAAVASSASPADGGTESVLRDGPLAPASRAPDSLLQDSKARICPVSSAAMLGAPMPDAALAPNDLRRRAHELVEGLLGALTSAKASNGPARAEYDGGSGPHAWLGKMCPVTRATPALPGFDPDRLRQQSHQFIETLLVTFNEATGEKGLPAEDRVPLIHSASPVQPGEAARSSLRIANEESLPAEVTLYSTNFVADCGYEIPSLRVTISPRRATIAARGEASFDVSVAVPQQTPRGRYAGLIQAMGYSYFKAVLSVEVL
jgi:hypothetical protein